jgi:hypothetical protein
MACSACISLWFTQAMPPAIKASEGASRRQGSRPSRWALRRLLTMAMTTGTSPLDALRAQAEAPALVDAIGAVADTIARSRQGWPAEIDALIDRMRDELTALHLDAKSAELAAVEKAVCAWGDEQPEGWTVQDLLDWYAGRHVTEAEATTEGPDAVTLTTIHGAKGLEWPCVWVLGCEEGTLPRTGDAEEPRRLAYVAITRGRERVRMCWTAEAVPSRFIAEALGAVLTASNLTQLVEDSEDALPF